MTTATSSLPTASAAAAQSEISRAWRRFRRNGFALFGLGLVIVLVALAILAPVIAPYGYAEQNLAARLLPPLSEGHPFGTDVLGRDILSRQLFSLSTALTIGFSAELGALLIALIIGMIAGYRGGRIDQALMGLTDVMYAFPAYLFTVLVVVILGRETFAIIIAIAVTSWVTQARLVRAQVLKVKNFEFVEAARSFGARGSVIATRYILPNAIGPLLVTTSFGIPAAIMAESGLAILGLGVAPPTPSWGGMIVEGYRYALSAPYLIAAPLALFAITMLAFTWVGDGLRDAFDANEEDAA